MTQPQGPNMEATVALLCHVISNKQSEYCRKVLLFVAKAESKERLMDGIKGKRNNRIKGFPQMTDVKR